MKVKEKCEYCKLKPEFAVMLPGNMKAEIQPANKEIKYKIAEATYLCRTHYASYKQLFRDETKLTDNF